MLISIQNNLRSLQAPGAEALMSEGRTMSSASGRDLRAKKPKVVIRCHRDEYKDPLMKQFELPSEKYKFVRTEFRAGGN